MSIPSFLASMPDWMRIVAAQVNPMLNGYPYIQLDSEPASPSAGFTYFDTGTGKVRTYDGSAWNNHY